LLLLASAAAGILVDPDILFLEGLRFLLLLSMDFVSQEYGVPHDRPKDLNAGG
jgi:hypothetical protein